MVWTDPNVIVFEDDVKHKDDSNWVESMDNDRLYTITLCTLSALACSLR
jgi:hypothetical protein